MIIGKATGMILSTTPSIEGKSIGQYFAVIGAEVFVPYLGFGDLAALITMANAALNSKTPVYEQAFANAREKALDILVSKAGTLGADAVVSTRLNYIVVGPQHDGLLLTATGTAVQLVVTDEQRERVAAQEKEAQSARDKENEPAYFVEIDGRIRGPFSVLQLRELVQAGRLGYNCVTQMDDGNAGQTVGEVLNLGPAD